MSRPAAALARALARSLLDTLLPPLCPGCEAELRPGRWRCAACRLGFRPAPAAWLCLRCREVERPGGSREAGFGCTEPGHAAWRGRAAFWMEPPVDAFVHALKFRGRSDLAPPLGRVLARRCPVPPGAVVAGVPLHPARRRERGYDQADLLARAAAAAWRLPLASGALGRARATGPQARLALEARAANVRAAFHPAWGQDRGPSVWVLVDDVVTTGATLLAATRALSEAGAGRVLPVALAVA